VILCGDADRVPFQIAQTESAIRAHRCQHGRDKAAAKSFDHIAAGN
jgi:hypothetical protein